MAKAIEASREAIGIYERNEVVPSVEVAKKIADIFDVTLDSFNVQVYPRENRNDLPLSNSTQFAGLQRKPHGSYASFSFTLPSANDGIKKLSIRY